MPKRAAATTHEDAFNRAALFLARERNEQAIRSLLVASAREGEGVTTVAYQLATALQRKHALRVLLLELHARNPSFVRSLGLDNLRSIQAVVGGRIELDKAIQTLPSGLALLPSELPNKDGGDPLPMDRVADIVRQVEERYDLVIADGPPILDAAEGLSVAALIPRIVLVVESGRTSYEVLQRFQEEIQLQRIRVLGTILNKQKRFIPSWLYRLLAR